MEQYLRKVRLTAKGKGGGVIVNPGKVEKHELTIAFEIQKGISSTANVATSISIYNLKEAHRNAMGKELDDIMLEAGYMPPQGGGDNVGVIFNGQLRDVKHRRSGADIITELTGGEGDEAIRSATESKSYPAGTKVEDVVEDLYKKMGAFGVSRGEMKFPEGMQPFKRPYVVCGSCKNELDVIGRGKNFYWSIQNGALEIVPGDGFLSGVVLISPETGMIGTPTITDTGIKVTALLNPQVRVNRQIKVESQTLDMNSKSGLYRVSSVVFAGDNRSGDFYMDIIGESVGGSGGSSGGSGSGNKVEEGQITNVAQLWATSGLRGDK